MATDLEEAVELTAPDSGQRLLASSLAVGAAVAAAVGAVGAAVGAAELEESEERWLTRKD